MISANSASVAGPGPDASSAQKRPPQAWRAFVLLLLFAVVGVVMLLVGRSYGDRIAGTMKQMYADIAGAPVAGHDDDGRKKFFTCGMHPWVILPKPGLCPICHMDLTPLDPSKFTGEIAIDPVLAQNIGVRTGLVEAGPLVGIVRTVGKIDYDETSLHDVNLRVAGWIEDLHVDYLGAAVVKDQPLFELYSPELFSAQQEYLLARQHGQLPGVPFVPRVAEDAATSLEAARTRLAYFGIDDAQIAELERTGRPQKTMTIKSPSTGTVIQKMAVDGMRVDPGMKMYRIADLDRVWVTVTVYEYHLPYVELGQDAVMSLPYVAGEKFEGKVTYVYPWTDEKTRQVNVRLEFDNRDGRLKPGMFANVELRRTLAAERTLVSRSAVIDTGERRVALVSLGNGRFAPRDLQLGIETEGGRVEVKSGLEPGERVVTSAQFLLDSESKIREGLLRMLRGDLVGNQSAASAGSELVSLPPALADSLLQALVAYLQIGDELAGDGAAGVAASAQKLADAAKAMGKVVIPGQEHFWHQHDEAALVQRKAEDLAAGKDLPTARVAFADLSSAFAKLLRVTGVPADYEHEVQEMHCPMFLEETGGAFWLQHSGSARNPYFGSKMLTCFDRRESLPATAGTTLGAKEIPAAATDGAPVDALVTAYLRAAAVLAADRTDGLAAALQDVHQQASLLEGAAAPIGALAGKVVQSLPAGDQDLKAARATFQAISSAVIDLVRALPVAQPLERAYCPMVEASWLQTDKTIKNPYMGSDMLECGSIQETLPARASGGQGR
jgi:membrane fusion protein, copper/silver efflux system